MERDDRKSLIALIRKTLDNEGYKQLSTVVNCSAQSIYETVQLCEDASQAGGDFALVAPPSYYRPAYTDQVVIDFYDEIASRSPIPIVLYNYPPVVAGMDLSSETIISLAKHKNIVGCKLTCGNVGKMNRIVNSVETATPFTSPSGFQC